MLYNTDSFLIGTLKDKVICFQNTADSLVLILTDHSGKCRYRPPDKEFRYLRTVIVTAAVHQGLV